MRRYKTWVKNLFQPDRSNQQSHQEPPGNSLLLEELEPRTLFSADSVVGLIASQGSVSEQVLPLVIVDDSLGQTGAEAEQVPVIAEISTKELVFVDTEVNDYEQLLADLMSQDEENRQFEIYLLDDEKDGIAQITAILSEHSDVDAIHIVSHGSNGSVNVGNSWLNNDNLEKYSSDLIQWGTALNENADLLFYGCDLAGNADGQALIQTLSTITGADVAASDDDTGHAILGGDWQLEYSTGSIETQIAFSAEVQQSWEGLLAFETYRDEFNAVSYTNSDGSQDWSSTPWQEIGEINDANAGQVRVLNTLGEQGLEIRQDSNGIMRQVDLSSAATATVSFDYARIGLTDASDFVVFEISANGGSTWTELDRYYGPANDTNLQYTSYDISNYAASNTQIRFVSSGLTGSEFLFFDNFQIAYASNLSSVSEFLVNSADTNSQETSSQDRGSHQAVAVASNGDYVVVWTDVESAGDLSDIFARRYNADGTPKAGAFQVNTSTSNEQQWATVASDASGRFAIVWTSQDQDGDGQGIYLKRFDALGNEIDTSDILVNSGNAAGNQFNPSVAVNSQGKMVITWQSDESGNDGIFAKTFDISSAATGNQVPTSPITVNTGPGRANPSVDINSEGKFVIAWEQGNEPYVQRFNADGSLRGSPIDINPFSSSLEQYPVVAVQESGDFLVAYRSEIGGFQGVWVRHYSDLGSPYDFATKVSSDTTHTSPSIAKDLEGNFVIVYEGSGDGDGQGIFARKYDSSRNALGSEFRINETSSGNQQMASVDMLATNNFVVVWSGEGPGDSNGVFSRQFNLNVDPKIYWADQSSKKIQRSDLDGSNVEDIVTGLNSPISVALDTSTGKIYFADRGLDKIQRANLDGSGIEDVVSGISDLSGIALDLTAGKLYWADTGTDRIQRSNLDGSNTEVIIAFASTPTGIALDVSSGKLYWAEEGANKIRRSNLDGSNPEDLVIGLDTPNDLTLDLTANKIYWADSGTNKILKSNLDGSNVEDVLTGLVDPYGVSLDLNAGKLYWTDFGTDKVHRADLDGSNIEDLVSGLFSPSDIDIIPDSASSNVAPILTTFTGPADTITEDTEVEITFTDLTTQGDEADVDGTVDAFVVKVVNSGSLKIGTDSASATAWVAGANDTVDSSNHAYWTPAQDANGTLNAFQVVAKDDDNLESSTNITVQVNTLAVNDAPTFSLSGNQAVAENSAAQSVTGFASASAGGGSDESGQTFSYTVSNDNPTLFTVAPDIDANGQLTYTLANGQFGTATVTVSVTDSGGTANSGDDTSTGQTFNINVTANAAPTTTGITNITVNEDANDTVIDLFAAFADSEDSDTNLTYSLETNTNPGLFSITNIDGVAGTLTLNYAANQNGTANLTVRATDTGGLSVDTSFSVTVNSQNDAPSDIFLSTTSVVENTDSSTGVSVGILSTLDADIGDSATYTVVGGADQTKFSIGGSGDELVLNDGLINFENQGSYQVDIRVQDAGGLTFDKSLTVQISDANENPVITTNSSTTVVENSATVMNIIAADEDSPAQQLSYIISGGADASLFSIGRTTGTLIFDFAPDFENPSDMDADNVYIVEATVDDGNGGVASQTLEVTVSDNNEAPVLNDSSINIDESSSIGTLLGNATATDPDAGENLLYTIISGNSQGVFQLNENGELSIGDNQGLTLGSVFTITLQVTDSSGLTDTATVTVQVGLPEDLLRSLLVSNSGFAAESSSASAAEVSDLETGNDEPVSEEQTETEATEDSSISANENGLSAGGYSASNDSLSSQAQIGPETNTFPKHQAHDRAARNQIPGYSRTEKTGEIEKNHFKLEEQDSESIINNSDYLKEFDQIRKNVQIDINLEQTVVGSSMAVTTGLSVGYVVWLIRGGVLLSSLLSSLPAWRMIDPLPVIGRFNDDSKAGSDDQESLSSLIKKGSKVAKLKAASEHSGSETEMDRLNKNG